MRLSLIIGLLLASAGIAQADILIGVAGPMTGQNAVFGDQMKRGAEAAIAVVNAAGGINGENLQLRVADDGCDAKRAVTAAEAFAAEDVRFVAGHFCSGASIAASTVYGQRGIIMMSPSASLPKVTDATTGLVFRVASRDDAQAVVAAQRIKQSTTGAKVAFVSDGSPAAGALEKQFKTVLPEAVTIAITPEQQDLAALVESFTASEIDVAYFATSASDAGRIVATLSAESRKPALYGADSVLGDAFWEKAGVVGEGMLVTYAADPQSAPGAASLKIKGGLDGAVIPTYAAVQAFAAAARKSNVNDARAMAQALRAGPIDTVLGPLTFDARGDVSPQRFMWLRWSQGSFAADGQSN